MLLVALLLHGGGSKPRVFLRVGNLGTLRMLKKFDSPVFLYS